MKQRTKVSIIASIAAFMILASLAAGNTSVRDILSNIGSGITGAFTAVTGGLSEGAALSKNISLVANLSYEEPLELTFPANGLVINFTHSGIEWKVGKERLDFVKGESISVIIEGWDGTLTIDNGLSLSGTATEFFVNGVAVMPNEASLSVSVDNIAFENLELRGVNLESFSNDNVAGDLTAGDKVQIALDGDQLKLGRFIGDIGVGQALIFDGNTDSVSVSGVLLVDVR